MRLALFSDTYAPQMNGVARTLRRLVEAVRARGGDVRVFTASDPAVTASPGEQRWASVPCPLYPELRLAAPTSRSVATALAEYRPTLVHAATPFGVGLRARACARAMQLPFVTSYHTSFSAYARYYRLGALEGSAWRFLRWFHNGGRRTFCPTEAVRSELAARGFDRTSVWSRGVDRARFSPTKRSRAMRSRVGAGADPIVVAYVGRIAREKGLDHVLAAMHRVRRSSADITFAFAGDGPYLDHCRAHAPAGTAFLGRLEGEELAAFYASADVFLFPSSTDTFGNVILEAMASALPVVAADVAPSREIARDAAVFYTPDDPDALAAALLQLARDETRRSARASSARLAAAAYCWEAVFDRLVGEYEAAVREPAMPPARVARAYRFASETGG
jgi:glycosyltransferase involved in cell wall biosynthesis